MKSYCILGFALLLASGLQAAGINVWVVGSTRAYGESPVDPAKEKELVQQVRRVFTQTLGPGKPMNLVFEEVYRKKALDTAYGGGGDLRPMEYHAHSLAQWFFWPESRAERLAALRGEGATPFDYVVLVGDPSIIGTLPGMYVEGVSLIVQEMRKGRARPILLIPGSHDPAAPLAPIVDVVARVGRTANIPVVPESALRRLGRRVEGPFEGINPFAMKQVPDREITYHHTGTSSERGIEGALKAVTQLAGVRLRKQDPKSATGPIDFNYGRGNSNFEANKRYKVDPKVYNRSYGFPMQDHSKTAAETMLYGLDRRAFGGGREEDGTDLGIAYDMLRDKEVEHDVRCIPIRLLWAKLHDLDPTLSPLRDRWHMSRALDHASAAYVYTLLSGRCPIGPPPSSESGPGTAERLGRQVGYETAWRIGRIQARAPGFTVRPAQGAEEIGAGQASPLTVWSHFAPKAEVQVAIGTDQPGALSAEPRLLTFTPDNHATPQIVTLTAGATNGPVPVRVMVRTRSKDPVYDQLEDRWSYTVRGP